MTKKLLVALDTESSKSRANDFLVPIVEPTGARLLGLKSNQVVASGLVVFVGRELTADELFAKLIDTGRRIDSVDGARQALERYLEQLHDFRIGDLLAIAADAGGFTLVKLADSPPSPPTRKLP